MTKYSRLYIEEFAKFICDSNFSHFVRREDDNIFNLVRANDVDELLVYLLNGGDPEARGHAHMQANRTDGYAFYNWSLLCEAAAYGSLEINKLVLSDIGLHHCDKIALVLWLACKYGRIDTVNWILGHIKPDLTLKQYPQDPAVSACEHGHIDICHILIETHQTNLNAVNKNSDSLLHLAIWYGRNDGRKWLHRAAETGDAERVANLLSKGCNVNEQDNNGLTPLHVACEMGYEEVVYELIHYGADIYIVNCLGFNALHAVNETSNAKIMAHLIAMANDKDYCFVENNPVGSLQNSNSNFQVSAEILQQQSMSIHEKESSQTLPETFTVHSINKDDDINGEQLSTYFKNFLFSLKCRATKKNTLDYIEEAMRRMLRRVIPIVLQHGTSCEEYCSVTRTLEVALEKYEKLLKKINKNVPLTSSELEKTKFNVILELPSSQINSSTLKLIKDVSKLVFYIRLPS